LLQYGGEEVEAETRERRKQDLGREAQWKVERGVSGRERITLLPSIIADCDMADKMGNDIYIAYEKLTSSVYWKELLLSSCPQTLLQGVWEEGNRRGVWEEGNRRGV